MGDEGGVNLVYLLMSRIWIENKGLITPACSSLYQGVSNCINLWGLNIPMYKQRRISHIVIPITLLGMWDS